MSRRLFGLRVTGFHKGTQEELGPQIDRCTAEEFLRHLELKMVLPEIIGNSFFIIDVFGHERSPVFYLGYGWHLLMIPQKAGFSSKQIYNMCEFDSMDVKLYNATVDQSLRRGYRCVHWEYIPGIGYDLPLEKCLEMIKQAGFDSTCLFFCTKEQMKKKVKGTGGGAGQGQRLDSG
jgi:hypothetical protein